MGISLALLCITRGDGIILAGLLFGLYFFTTKKIPYKSLALFILFLLPFLIFLYLYFGSITPNTLYVKMSHGKSGFWAPSFFLGLFYWIEKYFSHCFIISFITIPLFIGILNIYEKKLDTILILTWGFLYYLGYSLLHVPYYGQYYIPLIFPLAYFLGLGMQTLASNPILNGKIIKKIILCCFLFIILFPLIKIDYDVCKDLPHPSKEIYREIGLWIKQNTHKDASIAVNEIGIIGYYSQRRIIDILGLIMPNDIAYHLSKKNMTYWFYKYKPDYIVFHEKTNILFQKFEMPVATLKEFKDSYICTKKFNNPKYGKLYIYAKKSLQ